MDGSATDGRGNDGSGKAGNGGKAGKGGSGGDPVGSEGSAGAEGPAGSEEIVGSAGVAGAEGIIDGGVDGPPDAPSAGEDGGGDAPDAPIACNAAACPQPTNECQEAVCGSDGSCGLQAKADGVPATTQSVGDCKRKVCSGARWSTRPTTPICRWTTTNAPTTLHRRRALSPAGAANRPAVRRAQVLRRRRRVRGVHRTDPVPRMTRSARRAPATREMRRLVRGAGHAWPRRRSATARRTSATATAWSRWPTTRRSEDDGNACTDDTCASGRKSDPDGDRHGVRRHPSATARELRRLPDGLDCQRRRTRAWWRPARGHVRDRGQEQRHLCNDGNACTQTDTCQAGTCTGANPVICTRADQCHVAGTLRPGDRRLLEPGKADGTACNDGNACTQTDTCQAGACTGANPVVCTAPDQCHVAGTCNPATGVCSNPNEPTAPPATTATPARRPTPARPAPARGANPVTCAASRPVPRRGHLQPGDGRVLEPARPTARRATTATPARRPTPARPAPAPARSPVDLRGVATSATSPGTCNPATGVCSNPNKADGTPATTATPARRPTPARPAPARGGNPVDLRGAATSATTAGTCNPATGVCSNPTQAERHRLQRRQRLHPDRHLPGRHLHRRQPGDLRRAATSATSAGTCNPATGVCSNPAQGRRQRLQRRQRLHPDRHLPGGHLHRREPGRLHGAATSATSAGTCDPATGMCSNPNEPTARPATTATPARRPTPARPAPAPAANPVVCAARDQCHVAGTCNPATGACSNPPSRRHRVQRRQRLHADRHLPGRHLHRRQPGRLHGARPVPRRRHLRPGDGHLLEPEQGRRHARATTATPARRPTPARPAPAPAAIPVVCTASRPVPRRRHLQPGDGRVLEPGKPDGTACNDGNACTQTDTCQAGSLHRRQPGHLHRERPVPRRRDLQSGDRRVLATRAKADGTACNDGNACTQTDTCQSGGLHRREPVVCTAPDQCHVAGTCSGRPGCVPTRPSPHTRRVPRESATALASAWSVSSQVSAPAWIPSARCAPARRIAAGSATRPPVPWSPHKRRVTAR